MAFAASYPRRSATCEPGTIQRDVLLAECRAHANRSGTANVPNILGSRVLGPGQLSVGASYVMQMIVPLMAGFCASLCLTPLMRRWAPRLGLVDRPDGQRKLHGRFTALGGGVAVALATLVACVSLPLLSAWTTADKTPIFTSIDTQQFSFALAATLLMLLGLVDDRFQLRGRQKLLGQCLVVAVLLAGGLSIDRISLFSLDWELGPLSLPLTGLWLLAVINAVNLIDGADGMAGTVGAIGGAGFAILAAHTGHGSEAALAAGLSGALLGFLIFNLPPATIFLGDTGSMFIGLVLGVLSLRCAPGPSGSFSPAAPLALLALPLFDSAVALLRRRLTGRSIYSTDRGHLHHCLLRRGFTHRGMLECVAVLCGTSALGAVLAGTQRDDNIAWITIPTVLGTLVVSRVFGYAELVLLGQRFIACLPRWARRRGEVSPVRQRSIQLQGSRGWDTVWSPLARFAEQQQLCRMRLNIHVAWLHEGYHAAWERTAMAEPSELWLTRLPIVWQGRSIGHLELAGPLAQAPLHLVLPKLTEILLGLEAVWADLLRPEPCGVTSAGTSPPRLPRGFFLDNGEPDDRRPTRTKVPRPRFGRLSPALRGVR